MVMMIIVSMNCKSVDEDARISKGSSCSFGFCPNEGGGGPCPIFLSRFHKLVFWSVKGVYFLQNANNLIFKLFL